MSERGRQEVGASMSGEPLRDMALAGRTDAGRDIAEGLAVPASEARDAARMFVRWGDRQSARYWIAYAIRLEAEREGE